MNNIEERINLLVYKNNEFIYENEKKLHEINNVDLVDRIVYYNRNENELLDSEYFKKYVISIEQSNFDSIKNFEKINNIRCFISFIFKSSSGYISMYNNLFSKVCKIINPHLIFEDRKNGMKLGSSSHTSFEEYLVHRIVSESELLKFYELNIEGIGNVFCYSEKEYEEKKYDINLDYSSYEYQDLINNINLDLLKNENFFDVYMNLISNNNILDNINDNLYINIEEDELNGLIGSEGEYLKKLSESIKQRYSKIIVNNLELECIPIIVNSGINAFKRDYNSNLLKEKNYKNISLYITCNKYSIPYSIIMKYINDNTKDFEINESFYRSKLYKKMEYKKANISFENIFKEFDFDDNSYSNILNVEKKDDFSRIKYLELLTNQIGTNKEKYSDTISYIKEKCDSVNKEQFLIALSMSMSNHFLSGKQSQYNIRDVESYYETAEKMMKLRNVENK